MTAKVPILAKRYLFEGTEEECEVELMPYGRLTLRQDDDVIILSDYEALYKVMYDLNKEAIDARRKKRYNK